ncbi:hypothetical protein [Treponema sp.]|uniref:hypothetical protein n=1 Tax=Treponema sp. TaxID=166 RepID=UPI003F01E61A
MKKAVKRIFIFPAAIILASCATASRKITPAPLRGTAELIDSFEEENNWYAAGTSEPHDYSTGTDTSEEWSTQGDFCGQWSFMRIPQNGLASFALDLPPQTDLTGAKAITADINNTSQNPLSVFVEIQSAHQQIIFTTEKITLAIGENINVRFELITDKEYAGEINSLVFRLKGKSASGELFIDNINLVR